MLSCADAVAHPRFSEVDVHSFWKVLTNLYSHSPLNELYLNFLKITADVYNANTFLGYFIIPFLYYITSYINIESVLVLLINISAIFQTSIISDIANAYNYDTYTFWGLAKYIAPIFLATRLGCPFKITTYGSIAKVASIVIWTTVAILVFILFVINGLIKSLFASDFFIQYIIYYIVYRIQYYWAYFFGFYLVLINVLIFPLSVLILGIVSWRWMDDIRLEGLRGEHTKAVQKNLVWGAYLFMLTEVLMFASLFQATGYYLVNPSVDVSQIWEYTGVEPPYSIGLGFANLVLLFYSGRILQIAYKKLALFSDYLDYKRGNDKKIYLKYSFFNYLINLFNKLGFNFISNNLKTRQEKYTFDKQMEIELGIKDLVDRKVNKEDMLILRLVINECNRVTLKSILLGVIFMYFQYVEYSNLSFSISSGIYGTCFYCLTGLHGFHVIVGLGLLAGSAYQFTKKTFVLDESIFFWFSVRYWQFVDIVWFFVWGLFYLRSNTLWDLYSSWSKMISDLIPTLVNHLSKIFF